MVVRCEFAFWRSVWMYLWRGEASRILRSVPRPFPSCPDIHFTSVLQALITLLWEVTSISSAQPLLRTFSHNQHPSTTKCCGLFCMWPCWALTVDQHNPYKSIQYLLSGSPVKLSVLRKEQYIGCGHPKSFKTHYSATKQLWSVITPVYHK